MLEIRPGRNAPCELWKNNVFLMEGTYTQCKRIMDNCK